MKHVRTRNEKRHKTTWVILLLLLIAVAALCVTAQTLLSREGEAAVSPDYAPLQPEEHAQTIPDDTGEKMESEEGGGSVSLQCSDQVVIDLSDESVSLRFANPGRSNQDMVLQILVQDEVIVRSGLIEPGHQVTTLELPYGVAPKLSVGEHEGTFLILYYQPGSSEKAMVETEVPVYITVKE